MVLNTHFQGARQLVSTAPDHLLRTGCGRTRCHLWREGQLNIYEMSRKNDVPAGTFTSQPNRLPSISFSEKTRFPFANPLSLAREFVSNARVGTDWIINIRLHTKHSCRVRPRVEGSSVTHQNIRCYFTRCIREPGWTVMDDKEGSHSPPSQSITAMLHSTGVALMR